MAFLGGGGIMPLPDPLGTVVSIPCADWSLPAEAVSSLPWRESCSGGSLVSLKDAMPSS
jgi:hypothetical protein